MVGFKVEKMGCGGCAEAVTRAVLEIAPQARVEVNLADKLVTVSGADGTADRIAQAITAAGYPAQPLRDGARREEGRW